MKGRIYVPEPLKTRVLEHFHDNPKSGHFGATRLLELTSCDFYWPGMDNLTRKYVAGCQVYHRLKAPSHAKYGTNMPIDLPNRPWEGLTMDFITNLPESTASGYTGIAVIINQLTKYAIYLPCRKDIDSPELTRLFFEHVICKHGIPDHGITDRGMQFTSRFWERVCSHLSIDHCLSTAFHPQTDGQTEPQNQTMEQYLCAFANYEQDNWLERLPLAEFAYNNSRHTSTRMTQFFANIGYHPEMQFRLLREIHEVRVRSERTADSLAERLREAHELLCENFLIAQDRQTCHAGSKDMKLDVGDMVWLATHHIHTMCPSKKLDYKCIGPFKVSQVINNNAYRLDLPATMWIYNVFHVSLLDRYTPPVEGQHVAEPQPTIVDDDKDYEVKRILDSKRRYRKLYYQVRWAGYNYHRTTWEPANNLENVAELVGEFHALNPTKPGPQ